MKTKKSPQSKKIFLVVAIIAIAVIGSTVGLYAINNPGNPPEDQQIVNPDTQPDQTTDEKPPTDDQSDSGKDIKEDSVDHDETDTGDSVSVSISSATVSDDNLRVRTILEKVTNAGTCTLTLSNDTEKESHDVGTQALSSYSTCKGFDIDVSSFASGTWTIDINFKDGSSQGSASTKIEL